MTTDERVEKAKMLFSSGLNCAQSVALAFQDILGVDAKIIENASAPFGGGVGRMREICGTVSGMMMVLGLLRKDTDCTDHAQKLALYAEEQELARRFKEKTDSIICRELLAGNPHADPNMPNAQKHSCSGLVELATRILSDYLDEKKIDENKI